MKKVLIIAEAGVNHNGSLELAKRLIDTAAKAGADCVKFQTFQSNRLATQIAPKANYQKKTTSKKESQFHMLKKLELTKTMHHLLLDYCKKKKINFFSSAFDIQSLDFLNSLKFKYFKIPSGEITNIPYLRHVASFKKPIILSTGMSTYKEVEFALNIFKKSGLKKKDITILHCTSEYPTPMKEVNLKAMCTMRDKLKVSVGYSDHTKGIEVAIAAVALGATVIEKHFTIDRNLPGPDHRASLEPRELETMINSIRNIEKALGDGIKRISVSENKNKKIVRKSIVALKLIKKGQKFTSKNITSKRPGTGLSTIMWDDVIGKISKKNFKKNDLIKL